MVRKTSRVAYSFNYTEGGLLSLKAEWTKTATLKCWEHTDPARHEAPGAQNNKLISSFEHLWTWFCIFICFWSTVHWNIDSPWTKQLHKPFLINIQRFTTVSSFKYLRTTCIISSFILLLSKKVYLFISYTQKVVEQRQMIGYEV